MTTRARGSAPATRASTRTTRSTTSHDAPAPAKPTRTAATRAPAATARKPLVSRDNATPPLVKKPPAPSKIAKPVVVAMDTDREPIKAFLRVRPDLNGDRPTTTPYLERLTDTSVRMGDPSHDTTNSPNNQNVFPRFRLSTAPPTSIYSFSHVFPPATTQPDFFVKTTLPLVRGLLDGENGLLFAYGVTNSGKTYTMQGGSQSGTAGILPRTLDVLFNSVDGLQGNSQYKPVRLQGVELASGGPIATAPSTRAPSLDALSQSLPPSEPVLAEVLAEHISATAQPDTDIDGTSLSVDRNYEYSVWLSYAEVYNEKIYDLLADTGAAASGARGQPVLLTRKALPLRPSPAIDGVDGEAAGKYVSGLEQIRVNSARDAKRLVKLGQLHRRVFGTLANSQSSRSHGIVTIKLLRKHRGEKDEPSAYQTARLTLIDLAGSERTKHTQTTGDRLKEAGSINKSLMVLGQCMEVMRANQRRIAQALGGARNERADTRDVRKTLAVVPFRHSKLTEILMDYFVGDGRVIMIVNVNPYDTGFEENSHVMKFSALAKEISVPAPVQRVPPVPKAPSRLGIPQATRPSEVAGHRRQVTISTDGAGGRKYSQTQVDVIEEDEDPADEGEDGDDDPLNPLVEALFDEIENVHAQLLEAEMRAAIVEAETRHEVMREMEERMAEMEKMFARRLMNEVRQNEMKMDAKIDMLHQSGLFGKTPGKAKRVIEELDEEEDVENSILHDDEDDDDEDTNDERMSSVRSESMSPLAGKGKRAPNKTRMLSAVSEIRTPVAPGPQHSYLPSESSDGETADTATETESRMSEDADDGDGEDDESKVDEESQNGEDEATEIEEEESSDGEWAPEEMQATPLKAKQPPRIAPAQTFLTEAPSPIFEEDVKAKHQLPPPSPLLSDAPSPIFEEDVKAAIQLAKGRTAALVGRKMPSLSGAMGSLALNDTDEKPVQGSSRPASRTSKSKEPAKADESLEAWEEPGADDSADVIIIPKGKGGATVPKKKR
ncbi:kinesin-domain-containing protein [Auriscalpium vulgare]|uniref:Kinesin-domain-containing protein n=1 Tax=Auriscalpium vulgare TaxID=40419 RepID=A0ACB8SAI5_9AGAM|nr:kinesin-domain-containing protein [Auriscalpium vulgare]